MHDLALAMAGMDLETALGIFILLNVFAFMLVVRPGGPLLADSRRDFFGLWAIFVVVTAILAPDRGPAALGVFLAYPIVMLYTLLLVRWLPRRVRAWRQGRLRLRHISRARGRRLRLMLIPACAA